MREVEVEPNFYKHSQLNIFVMCVSLSDIIGRCIMLVKKKTKNLIKLKNEKKEFTVSFI